MNFKQALKDTNKMLRYKQRFFNSKNIVLVVLLYCICAVSGQAQESNKALRLTIDTLLIIARGQQPLLTYQFRIVYPPKGQDSSYRRSGFIHPLHTLKGQRLTRIQPPDHYHHYGIWNPWTHTLFEQDTVDFWNLRKRTGTVRFVKVTDQQETVDKVQYTALHHHVAFKRDGSEKVALHEWQTVSVHIPEDTLSSHYWVDISIAMRCATSSPVRLLQYRYGGLAWRATEFWDAGNSMVLTSEGNQRDNTDGSRARWCMVQGELPYGTYGGMAILSHPDNYNHPEPLRIWDSKANREKENLFINFSPTKDRDWLLEPDRTYLLRYRLVIFDGNRDAADIDGYWNQFIQQKL